MSEPPAASQFARVKDCDLCKALKLTPWFWEDDICWIAECEICETPMVVWRYHGTAPPADHVAHMRERLAEVATAQLGEFWVDGHMGISPTTSMRTRGRRTDSSATIASGGDPDRRDRADLRGLASGGPYAPP